MIHTPLSGADLRRPRKRLAQHDRVVGEILRRARIARGLSQAEAARDFDFMPQSFISKVERGARHVHPHELQRFAALYGLSLQALQDLIAHGTVPTDRADRVRRVRRKRQFELLLSEGEYLSREITPADAGSDAEDAPAESRGRDADDVPWIPGDPWPVVEVLDPSTVLYPWPLRPEIMPVVAPTLSPDDQRRREHLSHLLRLADAPVLGALTAEWLPVIDAFGRDGTTPLYEAVMLERFGAVEALIALGANPRRVQCFPWASDAREVTPLNAVTRTQYPGRLAELLCCGVLPERFVVDGYAPGPLHEAAFLALPSGGTLLHAVRAHLVGW